MTAPTFKTVLCAVDLSSHAEAALYLAAGLSFAPASRLVVLMVDDRAAGDAAGDDGDRLEARVELGDFVRRVLPGPAGYRTGLDLEVLAGPPAETILAMAGEIDADLIVVGTRGRGTLSRALFGSTTGELLRNTRMPIAVVPPTHPEVVAISPTHAEAHLGIILVPVDLERAVSRQLLFAARLSPGSGHHLLLMHVTESEAAVAPASSRLAELALEVPSARGWRVLAKAGTITQEVLAIARHEPAGVVVLGQSGVTPGNLAYELLHRGGAVVVVVP